MDYASYIKDSNRTRPIQRQACKDIANSRLPIVNECESLSVWQSPMPIVMAHGGTPPYIQSSWGWLHPPVTQKGYVLHSSVLMLISREEQQPVVDSLIQKGDAEPNESEHVTNE